MGRNRTGAWTTGECLKIELSLLLKAGYLVRGKQTYRSLNWTCNDEPSGTIGIVSSWPTDGARPSIRLTYTITHNRTGEQEKRDDTVYLEARPSNLGKGEVLHFICPSSGQRCRILYKGYGCPIWKSRQAYQNRIYYPTQKCSKLDYFHTRYWELDRQIKALQTPKRRSKTYRGKPTRRAIQLGLLSSEHELFDRLMFSPQAMPIRLRRALYGNLPGFEYVNQKAGKP